jgi:hypothetical protein
MKPKPIAIAIRRMPRRIMDCIRGQSIRVPYKLTRINGQRVIHVRTQLPGELNKSTTDVQVGGGMTNDMVDDACENPDYNVTITG